MSRSSSRTRALALSAAVGLLIGLGLAGAVHSGALGGAPSFHGTAYLPPEPAPDFRLTDHTGRAASLRDHGGKAVLLFFGYANCPDVCPLTLTRLSRILDSLGADTSEVRVLLVTVDPERDTREAMRAYVERFGPYVTGLTGGAAALEEVRSRYYVHAGSHGPGPHATINHTPAVFGIDRAGQIRVLLPMERRDEFVADDIRALLRL